MRRKKETTRRLQATMPRRGLEMLAGARGDCDLLGERSSMLAVRWARINGRVSDAERGEREGDEGFGASLVPHSGCAPHKTGSPDGGLLDHRE